MERRPFEDLSLCSRSLQQLPPVKPRWVQLTDAGPEVGVSNFSVRFRDAELVRLFNTDLRERCHRSRDEQIALLGMPLLMVAR